MKRIILALLSICTIMPTYSFDSESLKSLLRDKNVIIPAGIIIIGGMAWHLNRLSWKKAYDSSLAEKEKIKSVFDAMNKKHSSLITQLRDDEQIGVEFGTHNKWEISNNKALALEKERNEWKERANSDNNYQILDQFKKCAKSITVYKVDSDSISLMNSLGFKQKAVSKAARIKDYETFDNNNHSLAQIASSNKAINTAYLQAALDATEDEN